MKTLKKYCILGFLFVSLVGTLSHFVYEWSGNNFLVGFLFPINESTWEHMKLAFFPMLLYSIYANGKLKQEYPCVTSALLSGTLLSTLLIPILFYTYSGILGQTIDAVNIATYYISILVAFITIYRLTVSCKAEPFLGLLKSLILIFAAAFLVFTYLPPNLGIFVSPV